MKQIHYQTLPIRYKYQLTKTYTLSVEECPSLMMCIDCIDINTEFISLLTAGSIHIKRGYAWDGPSGPSIDTDTFMRGSLVHDALYQLIREGQLQGVCRKPADHVIHDLCIYDGMHPFRAWYVLKTLRLFGGFAARPGRVKKKQKQSGRK